MYLYQKFCVLNSFLILFQLRAHNCGTWRVEGRRRNQTFTNQVTDIKNFGSLNTFLILCQLQVHRCDALVRGGANTFYVLGTMQ